jgi:hypothetical protein
MKLRYLLFFLLLIFYYNKLNGFSVVKLFEENDSFLITKKGNYRLIPDNQTLEFLGFKYTNLRTISKYLLEQGKALEPVKSVIKKTKTCDDYDEKNSIKFGLFQDEDELIEILGFKVLLCNPSVFYFQGKFLVIGRNQEFDPIIYFSWLQQHYNLSFSLDQKNIHLGIGPGITELSMNRVNGQDPRPMVLDDNNFAIVTTYPLYIDTNPANYMIITYVTIDQNSNLLKVKNETRLESPPGYHYGQEKNWVPFLYQGHLYFIYSLDKRFLVIRQLPTNMSQTEVISSSVSHVEWEYGDLRGGTPARRIGKSK